MSKTETTREQYIEMREKGNFPIEFFYKYYVQNRDADKRELNIQEFSQVFSMFMNFNQENVMNTFDEKFDVNTLYDKDKNPVKFV